MLFLILENNFNKIEITTDATFSIDSADNKPYDIIYNPDNLTRKDWLKVFSIQLQNSYKDINIALIGSFHASINNCAVLVDETLVIMMNTAITIIDIETLIIKSHKHFSDFGIYFSLHRFKEGFIIHGELEIVKLSNNLDVQWIFSGRDIFVTVDEKNAFVIKDDKILIRDWEGTEYLIDENGHEIFN